MTQNEAVFQAVSKVFAAEISNDGAVPETGKWTDTQKNEVYSTLLNMFKAGEWQKNSGGQDDGAVMKYIPGLVNNHVRKDLRLNGGTKYETKRPGIRTGTGDESIKAMRTLLSMTTDGLAKVAIQAEIDKRLASLKPKVEIKVDALPESLRHLVPPQS